METSVLTFRDEAHTLSVETKLAVRETGIHDDKELEVATDTVAATSAFLKRVEAARTVLVKPLNDHVKFINSEFKKITDPVSADDKRIRGFMSDYYQAKTKARLEEQARLDTEALERAKTDKGEWLIPEVVADIAPVVAKRVEADLGTASFRENWVWEVADITQVPREYLTVDGPAITKAVKGGVREIAGIRVFNQPTVSMRQ